MTKEEWIKVQLAEMPVYNKEFRDELLERWGMISDED